VKIEIFSSSSGEGKTIEHVEIHTTKFVTQKVSSSLYMYMEIKRNYISVSI
jgi:hypothetical protein